MIPITIYVLIAMLFGAGCAMIGAIIALGGVYLGGMVQRESALTIENQHLNEEIARLHADSMLADNRLELARENIGDLEKRLELKEKKEAETGVYVSAPVDPAGVTLGSYMKEVDDRDAEQALGSEIFSHSKRLQEQLMRNLAENPPAEEVVKP